MSRTILDSKPVKHMNTFHDLHRISTPGIVLKSNQVPKISEVSSADHQSNLKDFDSVMSDIDNDKIQKAMAIMDKYKTAEDNTV